MDGATVHQCERNADCEDSLFCTTWRCVPGAAGADPRGCIEVGPPCTLGERCVEEQTRCVAHTCAAERIGMEMATTRWRAEETTATTTSPTDIRAMPRYATTKDEARAATSRPWHPSTMAMPMATARSRGGAVTARPAAPTAMTATAPFTRERASSAMPATTTATAGSMKAKVSRSVRAGRA